MAKKDELRKIKITKFPDGSGGYIIDAYFHQWGTTNYQTEDGKDFPYTIGIIERAEDGRIEEVKPEIIKFVDSF